MTEKALERLNYYNGQRLEASDLKLEQEYHIAVRRWLNRSLYSPGIARGLEVRAESKTATQVPPAVKGPRVVVSPGLALDAEGHEIILWEEEWVDVVGDARHHHGTGSEAEVEGLYLTIRYDETLTADEASGCVPHAHGTSGRGNRVAWGGPSRVLAKPVFCWRAFLPDQSSGEIVLAQVELTDDCSEVHQINTGVRRYVGEGSAAKIKQYALEGERTVAFIPRTLFPAPASVEPPNQDLVANERIYFHIRGRQPSAVTLYLRAVEFSGLYYSELGQHVHRVDAAGSTFTTSLPAHQHTMPSAVTGPGSPHTHAVSAITADSDDSIWNGALGLIDAAANCSLAPNPVALVALGVAEGAFFLDQAAHPEKVLTLSPRPFHNHDGDNLAARVNMSITVDDEAAPQHTHSIPAQTNLFPANGTSTPLSLTGTTSSDVTGATAPLQPSGDYQGHSARSGAALTYVEGLEIWIGKDNTDPIPRTPEVLRQLADAFPLDWRGKTRLGDGGAANDVLKEKGTGPIRLDFLPGIYFTEGEHYIELRVPAKAGNQANGGRILYNLYIE